MDLLRIPPKLYFKRGCLPVALREMKEVYNLNGAYIITSPDLFRKGVLYEASSLLEKSGLGTCEYFTLDKELTVDNVKAGLPKMHEFDPDLIVGIGDEAALNAAKIMWLLYENPEADLAALAGGAAFPQLGTKAKLVLIPTAGGTGSAGRAASGQHPQSQNACKEHQFLVVRHINTFFPLQSCKALIIP